MSYPGDHEPIKKDKYTLGKERPTGREIPLKKKWTA
jgi:hypothetical protein